MNAWRSRPVTPEEKQSHFEGVRSYAQELRAMGASQRRAGWMVGLAGAGIGVVGILCAATAFPLKRTEVRFIQVDSSTGYVGPSLAATDAPKLFNEQTALHYLRQYVEAREGYVPQTDDLNFHRVAIMSSPDEQIRYAASRKEPLAPVSVLGKSGSVRVENFHFSKVGSGKDNTLVYLARYDRTIDRGGTPDKKQPWSAMVQFQWHPELTMSSADRQINPAGFWVIAYQAQPDAEQRKQ